MAVVLDCRWLREVICRSRYESGECPFGRNIILNDDIGGTRGTAETAGGLGLEYAKWKSWNVPPSIFSFPQPPTPYDYAEFHARRSERYFSKATVVVSLYFFDRPNSLLEETMFLITVGGQIIILTLFLLAV